MNEIKRLGLEVNEDSERQTRENLRKEFGMAAMAIKSLPLIEEFVKENNVVIESLYSMDSDSPDLQRVHDLVRRWDGISWAVLFNQRSDDDKLPDSEIDPALHRAANAVTEWPKFDLFPQYQ